MPHNLGYFLTERFHIPHGFACAAFEPALLRHAAECAPEALRELERRCGIGAEALSELCRAVAPRPDIPLTAQALEAELPRWENNSTIQNTVGNVDLPMIRRIYTELFL